MAQFEPMEVDNIGSDFDDKENSLQNSNVLPSTEKGYEELDVSELNMKLRYSVTPAASPMSKSYTTNYKDNSNFNHNDNLNMSIGNDNCSLTRSLNSTLTKCEMISKSPKLPLQVLPNHFVDMSCPRRSYDADINNCTITVSECDNIDDNLLTSTTSSSSIVTPEATTPTKDIPKDDGGSPIMRGLKSVLNIFRSSQSPIPPEESLNKDNSYMKPQTDIEPPALESTPLCDNKQKELNSKRNSPLKESVVFNDDLERELQWKDDTTVIFKHEKIPIHKLFFHEINMASEEKNKKTFENLNSTVENMDVSYNNLAIIDKTMTENENKINHTAEISCVESDSEFVDCETSYIKTEEHQSSGLNQTISIINEESKNESKYDENKLENKDELNFIADDVKLKSDAEITVIEVVQKDDVNIKRANDLINVSNFSNKLIESHCELEKTVLVTDDLELDVNPTTCTGLFTDSGNISRISLNENNKDVKNIEIQKDNLSTTLILDGNVELQPKSENSFNISVPSTLTSQTDTPDQILEMNNKTLNDNLSNIDDNNLSKDEVVINDMNQDQILDTDNKTNIDNLPINDDNNLLNNLEQTNEVVVKDMDVTAPIIENEKDVNVNMTLGNMDMTIDTALLENGNGLVDLQNCNISTYLANLEKGEAYEDVQNIVNNEEVIENNDTTTLSSIEPCHEQKLNAISSTSNSTFDEQTNIDSPSDIIDDNQIQAISINEKEIEKFGLNNIEISKNCNLENKTDTPSEIPLPVDEDIEKDNEIDTSMSYKNEISISSHMVNESLETIQAQDKNILNCTTNDTAIQINNTFEIPSEQEILPLDIDKNILLPDNLHDVKVANVSPDSVSVDIQANTVIPQITENEAVDNEIVTSACNSTFEVTNEDQMSPPISPKLVRKGYNINFDDIDDPFATKSNIRLSPPLDSQSVNSTPNVNQKKIDKKRVQIQNRRKSQPEKKPRNFFKKSCNSSFDSALMKPKAEVISKDKSDIDRTDKLVPETLVQKEELENSNNDKNKEPEALNILKEESLNLEVNTAPSEVVKHDDHTEVIKENNIGEESITTTNLIIEKMVTKNVFNLPEIDDINFNPFSTKPKVCQSPPPADLGSVNCKPEVLNVTQDIDRSIQENKAASPDMSTVSSTSKKMDEIDNTVQEINTEDEDTIEGPFFEADVLADIDKLSDDELRTDAMQFKDFSSKSVNNENKDDGELFIDAEAYEFLLNQNKCNVVADNGRESLFLKFDPLFAKEVSSDGVLAALNVRNFRESAQIKPTKEKMKEQSPIARTSVPSTSFISPSEDSHEETNATISKPMMVVNPAVSYLISPRKSVTPPPRINRRSLTFTSPAMAVIDRLISLSGNTSLLERDTTVPHHTREYNETDLALTQLRELLAEKEIHVHNLRCENKELNERLSIMETQVKTLEKESEERLKKINDLNVRLAEKTKMNKSMATVVEEYERTIASLISEMDQEKRRNAEERTKLISERDEQTAHLTSMEVSFSDLHSKYEKSKQIILSMKVNEDKYKKSISEFEESLLKMQNNYELLKQHATSKLNHANQELEKFNRTHEAEVLKLNAMIKRKELHITSLEESLSQKTKANEELTAICDELINKVG